MRDEAGIDDGRETAGQRVRSSSAGIHPEENRNQRERIERSIRYSRNAPGSQRGPTDRRHGSHLGRNIRGRSKAKEEIPGDTECNRDARQVAQIQKSRAGRRRIQQGDKTQESHDQRQERRNRESRYRTQQTCNETAGDLEVAANGEDAACNQKGREGSAIEETEEPRGCTQGGNHDDGTEPDEAPERPDRQRCSGETDGGCAHDGERSDRTRGRKSRRLRNDGEEELDEDEHQQVGRERRRCQEERKGIQDGGDYGSGPGDQENARYGPTETAVTLGCAPGIRHMRPVPDRAGTFHGTPAGT